MADFFPQFTPTWHNATYPALTPTPSAANKTVLITGGGRGIGASIASSFLAASAARIILLGRSLPHLQSVRDDLVSRGSKSVIHIFPTDITSASAVEAAFASIRAECPPIDILVSNAGYLPAVTPAVAADVAEWWRGFEVNVLGTFLVVKGFLGHKAEKSVLVNVSTGVAHVPAIAGGSGYGTSKAAGVRFLEFVAAENPEVRVVSLHPGVVETEMYAKSGMVMPNDDGESCASLVSCFCYCGWAG